MTPAAYKGLAGAEAESLLAKYGPNSLPEKKKSVWKKLFVWAISPVSLMLLAAAALSFWNGSVADASIILVLFASNFLISAWHEGKADKSIEKLREKLAFKVSVLRDGSWIELGSDQLVPGDVVRLRSGSVVPADGEILEAENLSINESVLTGESLPKQKAASDTAYSGSFVATGASVIRVTATGGNTNFGKTATLIDKSKRQSALEKDILSVSRFVSIVSVVVIALLTAVLIYVHSPISEVATLDVSLLIAGIPVALPTVMSLIISVGILELAKRSAIVRRLASLEDLANVNLLLSDKTGTLTENKIYAERIIPFHGRTEKDVIALARSAFDEGENSPFDNAVVMKAKELGVAAYPQVSFIPGDSERKRATAVIAVGEGAGVSRETVSLGAAQVVGALCRMDAAERSAFEGLVEKSADDGYRAQVVAVVKGEEERDMELAGIILLADKPREDARATLDFLKENGVEVKMVTGDNYEISRRVATALGFSGEIMKRDEIVSDPARIERDFGKIAGFAEVLPEDKFDLVKMARKGHVAAVTGDGVNDLPAVRSADVGFAVSNAVDALKGTADIVLTSSGISVIRDAIIEARKIFVRLYNYSLYRISESFRLIVTIAVIGFIFKTYPLTPVEIIILAFLNDVPIVTLAFDRVKSRWLSAPARIDPVERFTLSTMFGLTGVANSLALLYVMTAVLHLPWPVVQTMFFLKLTVSGHMLIYVAHTRERWFRYLPSWQVIAATFATQMLATALAFWGIFTAPISLSLIGLVWVWSFGWMQIAELMKPLQRSLMLHWER